MPWGIAGAAVVGVAGSLLQKSAVDKSSSDARAAQQEARDQARMDLAPWVGTGGTANTASADILGLNGPDAATAARNRFRPRPGTSGASIRVCGRLTRAPRRAACCAQVPR